MDQFLVKFQEFVELEEYMVLVEYCLVNALKGDFSDLEISELLNESGHVLLWYVDFDFVEQVLEPLHEVEVLIVLKGIFNRSS